MSAFFNFMKNRYLLKLPGIFILVLIPCIATGLESNIGITVGYDDNVDSIAISKGSGYTETMINFSTGMLHKKIPGESRLFFIAFYKNFSDFHEELEITTGVSRRSLFLNDKLMAKILFEVGIYRNQEYSPDNFNRGSAEFELKYIMTDRIKLNFIQQFQGRTFPEPVVLTATAETDQNDLLISSTPGVQFGLISWLELNLNTTFSRRYSSINEDRYEENGSNLILNISPNRLWQISFSSSQFDRQYSDYEPRKDKFNSAALIISRMTDKFEAFIGYSIMQNVSTIDGESYKRNVSECGISYFF